MHIYANRFIGTALFFATIILLGTLGYMGIEGWSAGDSLYMTVITLTAVGYDEVHPLSPAGRIFTSFILAGGITGLGLWFAFLTSFIVELDLTHVFRHKRTLREIKKMKNHIIVCGAGRTGGQVVEELTMAGETFVIIERDKEKVEQILEMLPDLRVVEGDATTITTWKRPGSPRPGPHRVSQRRYRQPLRLPLGTGPAEGHRDRGPGL